MAWFIVKRIAYSLLILLGVTFITYLLLYMIPADPARQIAGRSATAEVVANIRHQLGLDHKRVEFPHSGRMETPSDVTVTGAQVVGDLLTGPVQV